MFKSRRHAPPPPSLAVQAWNNLGNAQREVSLLDDAARSYVACIHLQVQAAAAEAAKAAGAAHTVPLLPPMAAVGGVPVVPPGLGAQHGQRLAVAMNNLGGVFKLQNKLQECISCYSQVVLMQPAAAEAHANLASAFKDSGEASPFRRPAALLST